MKSIKILTLGNSYSNDAYAWLYPIFESAGYKDVILGYIINGGCNINHHWSNVDSDTSNDYADILDISFGDKPIVMDNLNIDEHIAAVGGEHVE